MKPAQSKSTAQRAASGQNASLAFNFESGEAEPKPPKQPGRQKLVQPAEDAGPEPAPKGPAAAQALAKAAGKRSGSGKVSLVEVGEAAAVAGPPSSRGSARKGGRLDGEQEPGSPSGKLGREASAAQPPADTQCATNGRNGKNSEGTKAQSGLKVPASGKASAGGSASQRKKQPAGKSAPTPKLRQRTPASQRALDAGPQSKSGKTEPSPGTGQGVARGKRARVPVDLSVQYGEKISARVARGEFAPDEVPKEGRKRLSREAKEERRQAMAPDMGLMQRLQRMNSLVLPPVAPRPKGRGWTFECGHCGTSSKMEGEAGLCPVCGAIALKGS